MWVFLFFLSGVTSGMEQAHFKDQMSRYLFQQHRTIEKLRPVIGRPVINRPSNHGQNRQLFESVQQELSELQLKIDNTLTLYEISSNNEV